MLLCWITIQVLSSDGEREREEKHKTQKMIYFYILYLYVIVLENPALRFFTHEKQRQDERARVDTSGPAWCVFDVCLMCVCVGVCVCLMCVSATCHVAVYQLRSDGPAAVHINIIIPRCVAFVFVRLTGLLVYC